MSIDTSRVNENEIAALYYNIIYKKQSRNSHPELFGAYSWCSSLYKRLNDGEESLKRKKFLDKDLNPTDLAYESLPIETLRDMLKKLRWEAMRISAKNEENNQRVAELEEKIRALQKLEKYKLLNEIAEKFNFLGVDENWIAVLISTNLVEQAMKKKLEKLGTTTEAENGKAPGFKDLVNSVCSALKTKENRNLRVLIQPRPLYDIRNKIDHAGYKMKISEEQARAIFVLVRNLIDDLQL